MPLFILAPYYPRRPKEDAAVLIFGFLHNTHNLHQLKKA